MMNGRQSWLRAFTRSGQLSTVESWPKRDFPAATTGFPRRLYLNLDFRLSCSSSMLNENKTFPRIGQVSDSETYRQDESSSAIRRASQHKALVFNGALAVCSV